jgi:hypothetical protein
VIELGAAQRAAMRAERQATNVGQEAVVAAAMLVTTPIPWGSRFGFPMTASGRKKQHLKIK